MNQPEFEAVTRNTLGTKAAKKSRDAGMVPASVSRPGQTSLHLLIAEKVAAVMKSRHRQVVRLGLEGQTLEVLVKQVKVHTLDDHIQHLDLIEVHADQPVTVDVPIAPVLANCPGLRSGGLLEIMKRSVRVRCPANAIPQSLPVDLSTSELEDTVYADKLILPAGATLLTKPRTALITVAKTRAMRQAEGEGEEGAPVAGEGAAEEAGAAAATEGEDPSKAGKEKAGKEKAGKEKKK